MNVDASKDIIPCTNVKAIIIGTIFILMHKCARPNTAVPFVGEGSQEASLQTGLNIRPSNYLLGLMFGRIRYQLDIECLLDLHSYVSADLAK